MGNSGNIIFNVVLDTQVFFSTHTVQQPLDQTPQRKGGKKRGLEGTYIHVTTCYIYCIQSVVSPFSIIQFFQ